MGYRDNFNTRDYRVLQQTYDDTFQVRRLLVNARRMQIR
jgi:hypothetical protein